MTSKLRDYINETMNDNRIFSYEDVIAMDNEEGRYYQKALDEQYGKIGFPNNKDLSNSSDVVYVHEYTRDDGTVVKAHYRSRNGQRNLNKPTMRSLKEYKKDLDKRVDDYMTQDAALRLGNSENTPKNPSISMPDSSGLHNVSISNADGNISSKRAPLSEELAQKYKEIKTNTKTSIKDWWNKDLYEYLTSPSMFELQRDAEQYPKMVGALKTILPDAVDTYMGNLTQGKNYEEENYKNPQSLSKISQVTKVSDLRNKEIKDFIYGTYKRIKPDDTLVVLSNNSKASESLKNSQKLQKTISTNLASIKNGEYENKFLGVNFSEGNNFVEKLSSTNMIAAYNRLSLYNPHFDENHNLKMYALDYVDYEQNTPQNPLNAINNNAYNLQNTGVVSPYLKIIELKFTPAEYKNFLK